MDEGADKDDDDEPDSDVEIEVNEENVLLTKTRQELLHDLANRLNVVEEELRQMKHSVTQCNFYTNMAKADADEANVHAGLAHGASEEATNMSSQLKVEVAEIEAVLVMREEVTNIVQDAVERMSSIETPKTTGLMASYQSGEQAEKFSRTAVFGGFEADTKKELSAVDPLASPDLPQPMICGYTSRK